MRRRELILRYLRDYGLEFGAEDYLSDDTLDSIHDLVSRDYEIAMIERRLPFMPAADGEADRMHHNPE